ncbi:hypothetical protein B296_00055704 [Ensete ventricosum]|uniref:Uncharacterized protein n=1 Tax=Ensete ventricosum TaxID=4639 RepID=A0A426X339_ENSVE|nr:hypothetical protein B296_00055704 [Ensete ventricosum]
MFRRIMLDFVVDLESVNGDSCALKSQSAILPSYLRARQRRTPPSTCSSCCCLPLSCDVHESFLLKESIAHRSTSASSTSLPLPTPVREQLQACSAVSVPLRPINTPLNCLSYRPNQSQAQATSRLSFAMAVSSFTSKVSLLLLLVLAEVSAQEHSPAHGPAPAMDNGAAGVSPGACAVALASVMSFVALLAR